MLINDGKGSYEVECNYCGDVLHIEAYAFETALEKLKKAGWVPKKVSDGWHHVCPSPDCRKDAKI